MSQERPFRFHDIFEYEKEEQGRQNKVFLNCKLLKPIEDHSIEVHHPAGSVIPAISMVINYYFWDNDNEIVEDVSMPVN